MNEKYAIFIDAENVSYKYINKVFELINVYPEPIIRRIYGDFSSQNLLGYKDEILSHALKPVQQFHSPNGKNAADIALVIDIMEILNNTDIKNFIIVSSDGDFASLAIKIREKGAFVIGIGENKTQISFIKACDEFLYLNEPEPEKKEKFFGKLFKNIFKTEEKNRSKNIEEIKILPNFDNSEILKIIEILKLTNADKCDENGFSDIGPFGQNLIKEFPEFSAKSHGFNKLSKFMQFLRDNKIIELKKEKSFKFKVIVDG